MRTLSVGCGVKLRNDVDVYLDLHPESSQERKATPGSCFKMVKEAKKEFVKGDVQNMDMFKNKEFDYVYAEHVLEHVDYPEAACFELQRVAKAGLVRCPTAFSEIFFGWEYHKWLVYDRGGELFFLQKRDYENIPFNRFFREVNGKNKKYYEKIIPEVKTVYDKNKKLFDVIFEWKDDFKYHVIREE